MTMPKSSLTDLVFETNSRDIDEKQNIPLVKSRLGEETPQL